MLFLFIFNKNSKNGFHRMKIVVACDKFKGSLSSAHANKCVSEGFSSAIPGSQIESIEIADGGEGSLSVFEKITGTKTILLRVFDPLGREIEAKYLFKESTAFIELATASGLVLLSPEEYNPLFTSTYGFGQMINDAAKRGAKHIITAIGGSATNDGGAGMLSALGFLLEDSNGKLVGPGGASLLRLKKITPGPAARLLSSICFETACDVNNQLLGRDGATFVYSGQKGANESDKVLLEKSLENFATVSAEYKGEDFSGYPGAGAAGGVGFALKTFLNSQLLPGWKIMADITGLEDKIKKCDLVVTGEGTLDSQSIRGKLVSGVAEMAAKHKKPLLIVCGENKLDNINEFKNLPEGVKILSILREEPHKERAMKMASTLLKKISYDFATFLKAGESYRQNN